MTKNNPESQKGESPGLEPDLDWIRFLLAVAAAAAFIAIVIIFF